MTEPNAALLMAFAGVPKPDDKHDQLVKERQETLDAIKVLNGAREREMKRIEGIRRARDTKVSSELTQEKARRKRNGK